MTAEQETLEGKLRCTLEIQEELLARIFALQSAMYLAKSQLSLHVKVNNLRGDVLALEAIDAALRKSEGK